MLKIKDDVDIDILKEFGYECKKTELGFEYSKKCEDGLLVISTVHRLITLIYKRDLNTTGMWREIPEGYPHIQDLVNANIVRRFTV